MDGMESNYHTDVWIFMMQRRKVPFHCLGSRWNDYFYNYVGGGRMIEGFDGIELQIPLYSILI